MSEEVQKRTEEEEDILLNELLRDAPKEQEKGSDFDLASLFENEEEATEFFLQLPTHLLNLWANNDRVIHIIAPSEEACSAVKSLLDNASIPGMQPELAQIYTTLKDSIQYSANPTERGIRLITLKTAINVQEVISAHSWANDPKVNIYEALRNRNFVIQPTMQELRMLLLIDTLLEIRENSSRIVVPGRVPSMVR